MSLVKHFIKHLVWNNLLFFSMLNYPYQLESEPPLKTEWQLLSSTSSLRLSPSSTWIAVFLFCSKFQSGKKIFIITFLNPLFFFKITSWLTRALGFFCSNYCNLFQLLMGQTYITAVKRISTNWSPDLAEVRERSRLSWQEDKLK